MLTLNLLPDVKRQYLRAKRLETRVIAIAILSALAAAGLVVVLAMWVYGVQTLQKSAGADAVKKNFAELKSIPYAENYLTLQNQLANISQLHGDKKVYSRLFDVLSKLNPSEPNTVLLSSVNLSDESQGLLELDGTTKTFTGLETFRDTLKNASLNYTPKGSNESTKVPLFSNVTVVSQNLGKDKDNAPAVAFKITATIDSNTFARTTQNFTIDVPKKDTTQAKQDAPIFGAEGDSQ